MSRSLGTLLHADKVFAMQVQKTELGSVALT